MAADLAQLSQTGCTLSSHFSDTAYGMGLTSAFLFNEASCWLNLSITTGKGSVASIWELCEAALMTAHEAPPSAPAVSKIQEQWKSEELQSLKCRGADSRVSPLVVPGQNEMQQVEIILEKQSPDVLSPFIVTVHFMPSDSLLWVKGTWFKQKSTCNLHRLLSHLVSMLWSNRDCLQEEKKKKKS